MSDRWATDLGAAGHAVLAPGSPQEALTLVRDGGIDVVVVDCYELCVDVVELSRAMQALPDAPPIVLVSASPAAPELSARAGVSAFILKPCEPAEVITAIARLLGELRPVRMIDDEPTGPKRQLG